MATITQRAQDALNNQEDYISPEESLKYLNEPQNFQSFAKYMKRLVKNASIELEPENLGGYLSKTVLALESLPKNEQRNIKNFFEKALKTDEQGNPLKMTPIDRKLAMKLCFAFKLNIKDSEDLLRKACNTYGFNVRDAYEATCFYCILTGQDYSKVQSLLEQYNNASLDHVALEEAHQTQVLKAVLAGSNWESNEQFLNTFLIPNKLNFTKTSRTTAQKYRELRCYLCEQIIQWNLASYEERNDNEKAESDELFNSVKEQISKLASEDPDFADYVAEFSDITEAEYALSKVEARLRAKNIDSSQGIDRYYDLINESVNSRQLVRQTLWGIPYIFKKGEFAPHGNSLLDDSPLMDCFPARAPFDKLDKSVLELSKTLTARKAIVFLCFMNEFFDSLCSEANYTRNADNPELAKQQYNNFYTQLNDTLIECGMAHLYPADPFDWLILKSAKALTQLDRDSDPIEYFNDILRLSFPAYPAGLE